MGKKAELIHSVCISTPPTIQMLHYHLAADTATWPLLTPHATETIKEEFLVGAIGPIQGKLGCCNSEEEVCGGRKRSPGHCSVLPSPVIGVGGKLQPSSGMTYNDPYPSGRTV